MLTAIQTCVGLGIANFLSIYLFDITAATAIERTFFQAAAIALVTFFLLKEQA